MNRRRSIRAVFRVQCGKCRGWLSLTPSYRPGTDVRPEHQTVMPTAERACNWPGERAARTGALAAGWAPDYTLAPGSGVLLCPDCKTNPLGIDLPEQTRWPEPVCVCTHPWHAHNHLNTICEAVPGVLGCGCLGWKEERD